MVWIVSPRSAADLSFPRVLSPKVPGVKVEKVETHVTNVSARKEGPKALPLPCSAFCTQKGAPFASCFSHLFLAMLRSHPWGDSATRALDPITSDGPWLYPSCHTRVKWPYVTVFTRRIFTQMHMDLSVATECLCVKFWQDSWEWEICLCQPFHETDLTRSLPPYCMGYVAFEWLHTIGVERRPSRPMQDDRMLEADMSIYDGLWKCRIAMTRGGTSG